MANDLDPGVVSRLRAKLGTDFDILVGWVREQVKDRKRSPMWLDFRKYIVGKNPACAACGGTKRPEVHHVVPFQFAPDLELVESNVIVLCRTKPYVCHLRIGHGGDFKAYNPAVRQQAEEFLGATEERRAELIKEAAAASLSLKKSEKRWWRK